MEKTKFWTPDAIDRTGARYRMAIGERSNGKTTGVLGRFLDHHVSSNYERACAYVRRYRDDLKGIGNVTNGIVSLGWVRKRTKGRYDAVRYWRQEFRLCKLSDRGEIEDTCPYPFMYAFDISTQERYKSQSFPACDLICFDEFITRSYYLKDEFVLFQNLLSTIIRDRDDPIIYMIANTVNKYCPYFEEMGLTNVKRQRKGTIDVYEYGRSGLRVAVEMCEGTAKKSDVYFAFDNPRLAMITSGDWEIDVYPHLPRKYLRKEVLFTCYFEFKGERLEGDVVVGDSDSFLFVHRKTTPIVEEEYPVYCNRFDPRPNWSRSVTRPRNDAERIVASMFRDGKVCYQTNEVGEIVRNMLMDMQK